MTANRFCHAGMDLCELTVIYVHLRLPNHSGSDRIAVLPVTGLPA